MNAEITITTRTLGTKSVFSGRCEVLHGERLLIRYTEDGDAVELAYADGSLEMRREGELSLHSVFTRSADTVLTVCGGREETRIPVHTRSLFYGERASRLSIRLSYTLSFSEEMRRHFYLDLSIGSEEK